MTLNLLHHLISESQEEQSHQLLEEFLATFIKFCNTSLLLSLGFHNKWWDR